MSSQPKKNVPLNAYQLARCQASRNRAITRLHMNAMVPRNQSNASMSLHNSVTAPLFQTAFVKPITSKPFMQSPTNNDVPKSSFQYNSTPDSNMSDKGLRFNDMNYKNRDANYKNRDATPSSQWEKAQEKAQMVVMLSRTRTAKDTNIVGDMAYAINSYDEKHFASSINGTPTKKILLPLKQASNPYKKRNISCVNVTKSSENPNTPIITSPSTLETNEFSEFDDMNSPIWDIEAMEAVAVIEHNKKDRSVARASYPSGRTSIKTNTHNSNNSNCNLSYVLAREDRSLSYDV